jgi:hypothetical protein
VKPKKLWQIQPRDVHWNGYEMSVIIKDGWEPFGVTRVPNSLNQDLVRLWMRRPTKFKKRKQYEVRIQQGGWGGHQVILHLTEAWEPFGVSESYDNALIWFRRQVTA